MARLVRFLALAALACPGVMVLGHPGEDTGAEIASRKEHLNNPKRRTLASCHRALEESGHYARELSRRMVRIDALKAERGFSSSAMMNGPLDARQQQQRAGCVLDPEVTEGPYWVSGELIRTDIREGHAGVPLHLDVNVIDVTTCTPIPGVFVEIWACNATGVYNGIVAEGNGAGQAEPDEVKNSAFRGVQPTNEHGTASFVTIVPGHYTGRTNHIHTMVHHGATALPNNTISGGNVTHVGQFYFDQDLLKTVEALAPYTTNKQPWMQNAEDFLLTEGRGNGDNPMLEITLLKTGGNVADGLHGVIDVGVNPAAVRSPQPAFVWTAQGGVAVPGSGKGKGPGGPGFGKGGKKKGNKKRWVV